jgi:uncharacterized protein (TIGR02147 family)
VFVENIEKSKYEFYGEWYHSVVREIVALFNFDSDFNRLGKTLIPQISEKEARNSVQLLEKLGFISRDESGKYHQLNNLIKTKPNSIETLIIQKFQIKMAELAIKAYDNVSIYERICTTTTFSISEKTFELVKKRVRDLQTEIMEMAGIDDVSTRVYQMTINIFPVSRSLDK